MKSRIGIVFVFAALMLILSACQGAPTVSQWPVLNVAGETVYLSHGTHLYAVNGVSGMALTTATTDGTRPLRFPADPNVGEIVIYSPAAVSEDLIVVGNAVTTKHQLFGLDPATLTTRWTFDAAKDLWMAGALIDGETVYAPSGDGTLYALDVNGGLKWSFAAGRSIWSTPVADAENIYITSLDKNVYAINKTTGELSWKATLDAAIVSSPALSADGTLFVGTLGETLTAFEAASGNKLWEQPLKGWVWSAPVVDGETIYVSAVAGSEGTAYALEAATGKTVWTVDLGNSPIASPLVTEELVIFATETAGLRAFNKEGAQQWTAAIAEGKLYSAPVQVGDLIIVAPMGSKTMLYAFSLEGAPRWTFTPEN